MTTARLTVAVCTRNRAELVKRTAPVLIGECNGHDDVELLFVENGCEDATLSVLATLADEASLKVVSEPVPGLSVARNRALAESSAPFVAFVDDDAVPDPGWCGAILAGISAYPTMLAAAGRIRLATDDPTPRLLDDDLPPGGRALLAGLDLGSERRPLSAGETPYGANMVFSRAAALRAGGFGTGLGRDGRTLLSMEEVDLYRRVTDSALLRGVWLPEASVTHLIPVDRLTTSYLVRRSYWQGRSVVRAQLVAPAERGVPRAAASVIRNSVRAVASLNRTRRLAALIDAGYSFGRAVEGVRRGPLAG